MITFKVLTPQGIFLEKQVDEIRAPGILGEFGVFKNHKPFVTPLQEGSVFWKSGNTQGNFSIGKGFFEVDVLGEALLFTNIATEEFSKK